MNKDHVFIYDVWDVVGGIKDTLRYVQRPLGLSHYTDDELLYWWIVVNLETLWCLPLSEYTNFTGNPPERHWLETLSEDYRSLLYRCVMLPAFESSVIDIVLEHSTLYIYFTEGQKNVTLNNSRRNHRSRFLLRPNKNKARSL